MRGERRNEGTQLRALAEAVELSHLLGTGIKNGGQAASSALLVLATLALSSLTLHLVHKAGPSTL